MNRSTDRLLTLGMALTTDRRAMEQRVRGVFARKKSAKGVLVLSALLVLALGFAAFTTACQPGQGDTSDQAKETEVPLYLQEEILTKFENSLRARVLRARDAELDFNSTFPAPRIGDYDEQDRGSWSIVKNVGSTDEKKAKEAFLSIANDIFFTDYRLTDVTATYYRDESKVRADIWRIDSSDGELCGALEASSLQFISAQCKTIPRKKQHESIVTAGKAFDSDTQQSLLDSSSAVVRIAAALGVTADQTNYSSYQSSSNRTYGWDVTETVQFYLDSGKLCSVLLFGDERLTPYAVALYPDEDCFIGGVYWYADRGISKQTIKLKNPIDFRVGEPDKDDMTLERAMEYYTAFLNATGDAETFSDPVATFYQDYSGARESYWHLRADSFSMNIAAKTGHIFLCIARDEVGQELNLPAVAFTEAIETQYEAETKRILESVLGTGSIVSAEFGSISDDTNCTIQCTTDTGALYSVFFFNRAISSIAYYVPTGEAERQYCENWLANYQYLNIETGEVSFEQ